MKVYNDHEKIVKFKESLLNKFTKQIDKIDKGKEDIYYEFEGYLCGYLV